MDFFLLLFFQSLLSQRMREYAQRCLLRLIEKQRGSRVILMVHRQETMSFFGIPLIRYMDINDAEAVLRAMGFNVNTGIPQRILELMKLYQWPSRGRGNVEYLPGTRKRDCA